MSTPCFGGRPLKSVTCVLYEPLTTGHILFVLIFFFARRSGSHETKTITNNTAKTKVAKKLKSKTKQTTGWQRFIEQACHIPPDTTVHISEKRRGDWMLKNIFKFGVVCWNYRSSYWLIQYCVILAIRQCHNLWSTPKLIFLWFDAYSKSDSGHRLPVLRGGGTWPD